MKAEIRPAVERVDRYVLPLAGRTVSRCYFDFAFGLFFYSNGPVTEIRIEGVMRLHEKGRVLEATPKDASLVGPFLNLFGKRVSLAQAMKTGALRIEFDDDEVLEVPPAEKFEPWELIAQDGLKLVSLPGGALAFWQSSGPKDQPGSRVH